MDESKSLQPFGRQRQPDATKSVRQELWGVVLFVGAIWVVFAIDYFTSLDQYGLVPRQLNGLIGVPTMTFLHADMNHLVSNTIPLFVLLGLLAGSRARSWIVVTLIILIGGVLLWVCGRDASHKGASLLIFGLMSYLIAAGLLFERRFLSVVIALVVGFMYGMTLISGVMPQIGTRSRVSWEGHLCGAVAGVFVAYLLTRRRQGSLSSPRMT